MFSKNSRHNKFFKYWLEIGSPELEEKLYNNKKGWHKSSAPPFFNLCDYRIAGDIHWIIREKWIISGFKIEIECKYPKSKDWEKTYNIGFGDYVQYRVKS